MSEVVYCRRDVLFDRRQQLCGSGTRIEVEFALEDFGVDAFGSV